MRSPKHMYGIELLRIFLFKREENKWVLFLLVLNEINFVITCSKEKIYREIFNCILLLNSRIILKILAFQNYILNILRDFFGAD